MKYITCKKCKTKIDSIDKINICENGTVKYKVFLDSENNVAYEIDEFEGDYNGIFYVCNNCDEELNLNLNYIKKLLENEQK